MRDIALYISDKLYPILMIVLWLGLITAIVGNIVYKNINLNHAAKTCGQYKMKTYWFEDETMLVVCGDGKIYKTEY